MHYTLKNNTNKDMSTLHKMVDAYFPYAKKEMGFDVPVTVTLVSDSKNSKNPLGKTAYYDPSNYEVVLYTDNRHPKDIMRSLSHELVHHKQNCNGELEGITGEQGYAQTEHGHRIEEEAYSLGNTCFRNWEDSVKKQINETTYSKRGKKQMNEDLIRDAIRKIINESPTLKEHLSKKDQLKEEDGIWAPNHYCVHHGGVNHNGKIEMAEAVKHNYNEELGRVTHYDMKLEDGTILENIAFEDIQVTNASLAEDHGKRDHPPMKRDDDKKDDDKKKLDRDGDGDVDSDDYMAAKDAAIKKSMKDKKKKKEMKEKPLKEWYDNSLYGKLLKEYTGGNK